MKDIEKKYIRALVFLCYMLIYAVITIFFVLYILGSIPIIRTSFIRISLFYIGCILSLVFLLACCLYISEVSSSSYKILEIKNINKLIFKIIVFIFYIIFSISLFKIDHLLTWFIAFEAQNICIYFLLFVGYKSKIKYKAQILQQYLAASIFVSFAVALLISLFYVISGLDSFSDLALFITALFTDASNYNRYIGKFIIHIFFLLVQIIFLFKLGLFPFCFIVANVYKSLDNSSLIFFMSLPKIMYLFAFSLNISDYLDIYIKDSSDPNKENIYFLYHNVITIESIIILVTLLSSIFFLSELYNSKNLKNQIVASSLATTSILFCLLFFTTNVGTILIYFVMYTISISILVALLSSIAINIKVIRTNKKSRLLNVNILDFDLSLINKIFLVPTANNSNIESSEKDYSSKVFKKNNSVTLFFKESSFFYSLV